MVTEWEEVINTLKSKQKKCLDLTAANLGEVGLWVLAKVIGDNPGVTGKINFAQTYTSGSVEFRNLELQSASSQLLQKFAYRKHTTPNVGLACCPIVTASTLSQTRFKLLLSSL